MKTASVATLTCRRFESPLGPMLLAASDRGLAGVWFRGQRHGPAVPPGPEAADHPVLDQAVAQLTAYFAGERSDFALPLDLALGTPFQQSVWQQLLPN
jgi:methylated-DNA-[protein]-cysteine S-methyltransferase